MRTGALVEKIIVDLKKPIIEGLDTPINIPARDINIKGSNIRETTLRAVMEDYADFGGLLRDLPNALKKNTFFRIATQMKFIIYRKSFFIISGYAFTFF